MFNKNKRYHKTEKYIRLLIQETEKQLGRHPEFHLSIGVDENNFAEIWSVLVFTEEDHSKGFSVNFDKYIGGPYVVGDEKGRRQVGAIRAARIGVTMVRREMRA